MKFLKCIDVKCLWQKKIEDVVIQEIDICPTILAASCSSPGNYNLFLVVESNESETDTNNIK